MPEVSSCNLLYNGMHLIIIGLSAKQHQFRQKRLHESEPDRIRVYGDQKRHCPESQYSLKACDDASSSQFEILSKLVQEIQDIRVTLGQLAADFSAQRELAISVSRTPCGICATRHGRMRAQDDFEEGSGSFSDEESQLPYMLP